MIQSVNAGHFPPPWATAEQVHSERLVERSAPHAWQIRPHTHSEVVQLFLVLSGGGRAELDSDRYVLSAPCLLIVPPRCVHGFDWLPDSDGLVVSIRSPLIQAMAERIEPLRRVFGDVTLIPSEQTDSFIRELIAEIHAETTANRSFKDLSLDSLVRSLAIWLARHSTSRSARKAPSDRSEWHYARFAELVDERHRSQWSVADYAAQLGITPSHLNSICREQAGKTSLAIIHARQVLAAKRELAYTERNIAGVAQRLGFNDPSYFARFFRRETGMTPREFRRRSGTREGTFR